MEITKCLNLKPAAFNPLDLSDKCFAAMCAKHYERRQLTKKEEDELSKLALQTDKMINGIEPCKDDRCFQGTSAKRETFLDYTRRKAPERDDENMCPPNSPTDSDSDSDSDGEHSERTIERLEKEYYDFMTKEAALKDADDESFTDCATDSFSESED